MITEILRSVKRLLIKIKSKNIVIGKNTIIDFGVIIDNKYGRITLGENVYLRSISKGYQAGMPFPTTLFLDVKGAELKIGARSRINGAYLHAKKSIQIGEKCVIASGVNIMDSNGHELYSLDRTINRDNPDPIAIGNNVWIGLNAIILKGTQIGDNSVVAAGSVVKGIFPPNSLIVGNPAEVVKKLDLKN